MNAFERCLVDICAPTLAGIKIAGLFRYLPEDGESDDPVSRWDHVLAAKGLRVMRLTESGASPLVCVFRPAAVDRVLRRPDTAAFLSGFGYGGCDGPEEFLDMLKKRLRNGPDFPHEIGVFLGYPLNDVLGFIENKGQRFIASGCWKAYERRRDAESLFSRYHQCRTAYQVLYSRGAAISDLTLPDGRD